MLQALEEGRLAYGVLCRCPHFCERTQKRGEVCSCCARVPTVSQSVNTKKARIVEENGSKGADAGLPDSLAVSDPKQEPGYAEEGKREVGEREVDEGRKRWREGWYQGEYLEPVGQAKGYEAYNPQTKERRKQCHSTLGLGRCSAT